jgi:hypothetical protein
MMVEKCDNGWKRSFSVVIMGLFFYVRTYIGLTNEVTIPASLDPKDV